MQVASYTDLPLAASSLAGAAAVVAAAGAAAVASGLGAGAGFDSGSLKLAPAWLAMYATARAISVSVKSGLPPRGGIWRMPLTAFWASISYPWARRLAHAPLSPILGALSAPVA